MDRKPQRPPTRRPSQVSLSLDDPVVRHLDALLHHLLEKVDCIMSTQAELAADLRKVSEQLNKVSGETSATLQKVADLEAALANGGMTSAEVDQAVQDLKDQVQRVDDLVQDAPPAEPPAEEPV